MKNIVRVCAGGILALTLSCFAGPTATPAAQWDWAKTPTDRAEEPTDGIWTGIFTNNQPGKTEAIAGLETSIGRRFASIMWFLDFTHPFPQADAEACWNAGYLPNVTWEPWVAGKADSICLDDILGGKYDAYMAKWAKDAAAFGKPFFLRWGHEFNGDWYPWSVAKNGQDGQKYVAAYRYVRDLVVKNGALNAIWVWGPNNQNVPAKPWNDPSKAYPGDEYVDWIALDGYDFEGDKSFADLFERLYGEMVRLYDKPIFLGEFATGRTGEAKAAWIKDMHEQLKTKFPAIKGLVWFDINKERDWRIEESAQALQAAREVFSSDVYRSRAATIQAIADGYAKNVAGYRSQIAARISADKKTATAVKIDRPGSIDWKKSVPLAMKGSGDSKASVQLLWDDEALFLGADVTTKFPIANPQKGENIWNGSGVEITISTDPTADPMRGYFTETDWQFGFSTGDQASGLPPQTWEWSILKASVPQAIVKVNPIAGGYRLEAKLPWSVLKGFRPQSGLTVGFDVAIDDANGKGKRGAQWVWNGNSDFYNSPVQWGVLKF